MELTILSDPSNVRKVEDFIFETCETFRLSDDDINALMIAVTEASNNAIHHGNHGDPSKTVKVSMILDGNSLTVSVSDQGKGFDPHSLPDPLAEENILKTSGRGVFLMKNIMKSVKYDFSPEGTTVTMLFHVSPVS
ncbi:MAG: ATP-binding protein [Bacteroidetes bacterium]|nr:ATP-binding protein [Bacteroidota bacterium]